MFLSHGFSADHGLKMCIWFGYYPHIIFVTFLQVEISHFFRRCYIQSKYIVGTLQFYAESFITLQML